MKTTMLTAIACLALTVVLWSAAAWGGLSISPAFLEMNLNKGTPSGQFLITNTGEEVERYRVKMVYFTFAPDGGYRELPPDEHSLVPYLKFNPKERLALAGLRQIAERREAEKKGLFKRIFG